jgi:hypothetical protein
MNRRKLTTYEWIEQIFRAKAASTGGVIRRKVSSVLKHATVDALIEAVNRRGFHLILNGEYFVILCNSTNVIIVK